MVSEQKNPRYICMVIFWQLIRNAFDVLVKMAKQSEACVYRLIKLPSGDIGSTPYRRRVKNTPGIEMKESLIPDEHKPTRYAAHVPKKNRLLSADARCLFRISSDEVPKPSFFAWVQDLYSVSKELVVKRKGAQANEIDAVICLRAMQAA